MRDKYKIWNDIEKDVYYKDGSLRDIFIKGISMYEWLKWIRYVNENYTLTWFNGLTQVQENKINEQIILDYLEGKHDLCSSACVSIGNTQINCHFFDISEIENDIDPREFTQIEDHEMLVKYMIDVSCLLNKEVVLTGENMTENVLIRVKKESIDVNCNESSILNNITNFVKRLLR